MNSFPSEMFAQLLLELPDHRTTITNAYKAGDLKSLGTSIHKLLGGAAYCDVPELTAILGELRQALKTENTQNIELYYLRTIDVIDTVLRDSGYHGEHLEGSE